MAGSHSHDEDHKPKPHVAKPVAGGPTFRALLNLPGSADHGKALASGAPSEAEALSRAMSGGYKVSEVKVEQEKKDKE